MDNLETITIGGQPFCSGTAVCLACDKEFTFTIAVIAFIIWAPYCYDCGLYDDNISDIKDMIYKGWRKRWE